MKGWFDTRLFIYLHATTSGLVRKNEAVQCARWKHFDDQSRRETMNFFEFFIFAWK